MKRFSFALALVASGWALCATAEIPGQTRSAITLGDALQASLIHNPQLAGYQFRRVALAGEKTTAALRPELRLQSELENLAGSGAMKGTDAAELTLSFSSVLELGSQRDTRINAVTARQQQLATEQRVAVLDVVAAVSYRFVALIAAQEQVHVQEQAQQLANTLVDGLTKRVNAGNAPQAELLRARAAQAKATLAMRRAQQQVHSEALKLSAYWGDSQPQFTRATGDLLALTNPEPIAQWQARLNQNPDVILLADATRLRTAELRKAEAEAQMAVEWNAGVRRMQETQDTALVVGVSAPLAAGKRASGAINSARAAQDAANFDEDSSKIQLEARLNQTYSAHTQALAELYSLRDQILPLLQEANRATTESFEQGRYSSLDVAFAQRELLEARAALIDVALRAHETRIELERLTASAPLVPTPLGETAQ